MEKTLLTVTVDEFLDAFARKFGLTPENFTAGKDGNQRNLIYGLKELARLLGCSVSTAMRLKKSGVLDPAIHQKGKIVVIDADLALDLLKVKKPHTRNQKR